MSRKKQLAAQILNDYTVLESASRGAAALERASLNNINAEFKQTTQQIETDYATKVQQANTELAKTYRTATTEIQTAVQKAGLHAAPWTASAWDYHTPPKSSFPPTHLRLGELRLNQIASHLPSLPALLPLIGQKHALVSFDDANSRLGAAILESLAWRIAALSAPGTYRFILLDPLDRGTNLASLLKLPENLRGTKIYCQDNEVEQTLLQLAQDLEEIIQRRLLNTYQDIEAYNTANADIAIPYRFLVFAGFPKGFTSKSADLLSSIARTGRRAGCYLLGGVLKGGKPPHDFDFSAFMKLSTYISVKGTKSIEWNDPQLATIQIQPDPPPPAPLIDRLAAAIQPLAVASASTSIPFQRIATRKAHWWEGSGADGLEAVLGIDESGGICRISIGQGVTHHALVGGATGTGKTNLLHLLVLMLSTTYPPEELELYLVDFKEGVEFQDYVTYGLPHARAVVLEAEREFGLSMLQRLVEEMERRSQLFKTAQANDIQEYRKRTGRIMPRALLIMDEYVVLFNEDDRLSLQASEALAALVMRGRSFGIHVLLSAQRPASSFLSMSHIKSQMGLRLALKCRPEDSTLILGEGNEKAARLSQSGEACITADPDRLDATVRARIARVAADERALYLRGLREFAKLRRYIPISPMIVFSRDAHATWAESPSITQRLALPTWKSLPAPLFWLGQPLRIADDLSISLEPHQGANVLILGSDELVAMRLLLSSILGLGLTISPKNARFLFIGTLDPQQSTGRAFKTVQDETPHAFQICARNAAVDALNDLTKELDNRLAQLPARPGETIFFIVAALHRWLEVRGSNAYTPHPAGEQLARLCQLGPQVAIHTIIWSDRLNTLGSIVGSGSMYDTLAQFGHRVALQMSSDESVNFLGGSHAAKLGSERAYYRSEQWPSDVLDKFKPYALPAPTDLSKIVSRMKDSWNKP